MIREAGIDDIKAMHMIRMAVKENVLNNPLLVTHDDYVKYITVSGKGWLCEIDNEITGFAIIDTDTNNIWALFMHPAHEKKGIGKMLHDTMLDWHFSRSDSPLWLSTAFDTRAEQFYRKAGWRQTGILKTREIKFEIAADEWK